MDSTTIEISAQAWAELADVLRALGRDSAILPDGSIVMGDFRLECGLPGGDPSPECDPSDPCAGCRCRFARWGRR